MFNKVEAVTQVSSNLYSKHFIWCEYQGYVHNSVGREVCFAVDLIENKIYILSKQLSCCMHFFFISTLSTWCMWVSHVVITTYTQVYSTLTILIQNECSIKSKQ